MSQPPIPPIRIIGGGPATPSQLQAYEWASKLPETELVGWRSLATSWVPTVSTLLALLGAGSVLGADEAVRALSDSGWQVLYGVCVGIALILGAAAIYAEFVASQPGEVSDVGPGIDEQVLAYQQRVTRAKTWLRVSRLLTAGALLFLACSFAVRWYAPVDPPPPNSDGETAVAGISGVHDLEWGWIAEVEPPTS